MLQRLEHKFVTSVPRMLELGVLYISLDYATVVHSCCCGCGEEVVTPLSPTDWNITFDGVSISLSPSVGSWNLKCRSHYFLRQGKVIPAGSWSEEKIAAELQRDKRSKANFYNSAPSIELPDNSSLAPALKQLEQATQKRGLLNWFIRIFK
jgi:hypothetical protein